MKLSMKASLIICLGMMATMALSSDPAVNDPLADECWQAWKEDHGKKYNDLTEETMRYKIWKNCTMNKDPTNNSTLYAKSCDYPFADWTQDEIDAKLKGNRPAKAAVKKYALLDKFLSLGDSLPSSVDYRQGNMVTYVKNQGSCGSCWAFAASGALEGQLAKKSGQQVVLSVQQFIDCDRYDYGCNGGSVGDAFYYLAKSGGLQSAVSYPYSSGRTLKAGTCAFNQQQVQVRVKDYSYVQNFNDNALMQTLASVGPVAVNVCANRNFQYYQSGVFSDKACSQSTADHAVLLVGYNSASRYWIVKNSWGTNWGQSGYIYMAMGRNLLVDPVYPIIY